jgi:hypothetical protein
MIPFLYLSALKALVGKPPPTPAGRYLIEITYFVIGAP